MVRLVVGSYRCAGKSVGGIWRKMDGVGTECFHSLCHTFLLYAEVIGDDEAAAGVGGKAAIPQSSFPIF